MTISRRTIIKGLAASGIAAPMLLTSKQAWAAYPDRAIRIVVPFAAGGNADVQGRIIAEQMQKLLGQPVVIDNRGGAGGGIGSEVVAKSAPDGYTLLVGSNGPMTVNPLVQKVNYDTFRDFVPVSLTSYVPHTLVVHPKVEARTLADLVTLSKTQPINVGIAGIGSATHMTSERIKAATGGNLTLVPYRSGGALMPDLLGGNIQAAVTEFSTSFPVHKDGLARILAVAAEKRLGLAPEIPTMKESGADVTAESFTGILAPAGTPQEIIALLEKTIIRALKEGPTASKLRDLGAEIASDDQMTGAGLGRYLAMDYARMKIAADLAGLKPE